MRYRGIRTAVAAASVVLLALGSTASAEEKPSIEPRAERILRAAVANIAAARSFTLRAEVTNETVLPSGQKIQYSSTIRMAVRRPAGIWYRVEGEERRNTAWYDGKTFNLLDESCNVYATWKAPATIDVLFDEMKAKLGFRPPLSVLLHEDVESLTMKKVQNGFFAGKGVVNGVVCDHLAFSQEDIDWQIWVEEVQPLLRRAVLTFKRNPGSPQYTATFLDWDFKASLSDYVFEFQPPPGASEIEFQAIGK